jgi:TPR repeat protein
MLYPLRLRTLLFLTIALLFSTTPLMADMDSGLKAVEEGEYMTAYQAFKPLAEQGDVEAQHNLAVLFKTGKGVMKDLKKAAQWFRKAADQGLAEAQFNLGHMYDRGEGVEQNASKAVLWYKKAAEQGYALAQTNLGVMYANGEGIKQDVVLGYVWLSLAASQGVNTAYDDREVLLNEMTPEMKENVRKLTREYFKRYVMPFEPDPAPRPHSANALHKHPKTQ